MQTTQRSVDPFRSSPYEPRAQRCPADRRRRQGARSEAWGRSAEEFVAKKYVAMGAQLLEMRARTEAGEIDLVLALGNLLIFVEVKARKSIAEALAAAPTRGWARRGEAALAYAAAHGHAGDVRLDLAAVDRAGNIEILENAGMAASF